MGAFTLNLQRLPIKLHYGFFNAGAFIQNVMPVYSKVFGFSSYSVGIIYTILPLIAMVVKPITGAIADKFKWHRGVLIVWVTLTMCGFLFTWFIPHANQTSTKDSSWSMLVCNNDPTSSYPYLSLLNDQTQCSLTCPATNNLCLQWNTKEYCHLLFNQSRTIAQKETCVFVRNLASLKDVEQEGNCVYQCKSSKSSDGTISDAETFASWQYWVYILLLTIAWSGISVVNTLGDTICIEICGDSSLYGKQRLWGSITWGLASLVAGLIIDAISTGGPDAQKNYNPAYIMMLPPIILDIILCFKLKVSIPAQSKSIAMDAWKLLLVPRNIIFMVWCTMVGASFGLIWNFLFWLLEDLAADSESTMDYIKTTEGLISAIETFIGEVPAFFFGGWIVNKIGHGHSMSLVFITIGIRFVLYSFLTNPWWCLPIEVLQNNYGLFYSTMTSYAKMIAAPGTEATVQSIFASLCEGLGVALGSYLGGLFFDLYGGSAAFLIFGVFFVILSFINEVIEFTYKMMGRRSSELRAQSRL